MTRTKKEVEELQQADEDKQNPIVDVGADPDPNLDGNERADEKVRIEQPDGSEAPRAR